jgi:hypothetical protein
MPIATIVRNIAELPTALPMAVKNSRRRMSRRSDIMPSPVFLVIAVARESLAKQHLIIIFPPSSAALTGYGIRHRSVVRIPAQMGPAAGTEHMHNRPYGLFFGVCPNSSLKNNARSQD